MPAYLDVINLDLDKQKMIDDGIPVVELNEVLNDDLIEENSKYSNFKKITSTYNGDSFSMAASCGCGYMVENYSIGQVCPECNTIVTEPFKEEINSLMWFTAPEGVAPLINPYILSKLLIFFDRNNFNYIKYLIDSSYKGESDAARSHIYKIEAILTELGIFKNRGRRSFIENFFPILEKLINSEKNDKIRYPKGLDLLNFLRKFENNLFTRTIPIVNKALLVIEETNNIANNIMYVDQDSRAAINSIDSLRRINFYTSFSLSRGLENRISRALIEMSEFYSNYVKNLLSPKKGKFRQGIYGFKYPYSFRCVVTPITRPHHYIELEIPWLTGLIVLREMILNKLYKMKYNYRQATHLLSEAIYQYCPIIDSIFIELINEAPHFNRIYKDIEELSIPIHGIPVNMLRWPTLEQGSIHFYTVTKITKDPYDYSIKMPGNNTKQQNGDFDGDADGAYLHISVKLAYMARVFLPHNNICNMIIPDKITNNLFITKPTRTFGGLFIEMKTI